MATNPKATSLEYAAMLKTAFEMHEIDRHGIEGSIISSVVPSVTGTVQKAVLQYLGITAMLVRHDMNTGLEFALPEPEKLGSDLIVDAVAAVNEYPLPLIVIDMGTATTLSVVDRQRRYLGGAIMPGVGVSHDSLVSRTAQLPDIALTPPERVISNHTVDCMKSGLLYGTASALDGLVERMQAELGEPCTVVATGGLAGTVVPLCTCKMVTDDDLLLKGLMILYHKN
jgi:type III pantothenate kinase